MDSHDWFHRLAGVERPFASQIRGHPSGKGRLAKSLRWPISLGPPHQGISLPESPKVIAEFLRATLKEDKKAPYLANALHAFEHVSGQRWKTARVRSDSEYRDAARQALEWWDRQER